MPVAKFFFQDPVNGSPGQLFVGKVVDTSSPTATAAAVKECYYRILYEDDDQEDFDRAELQEGNELYRKTKEESACQVSPNPSPEENRKRDSHPPQQQTTQSRKRTKITSRTEDNISDQDIDKPNGRNISLHSRRERNTVKYTEVDEDMDLDMEMEEPEEDSDATMEIDAESRSTTSRNQNASLKPNTQRQSQARNKSRANVILDSDSEFEVDPNVNESDDILDDDSEQTEAIDPPSRKKVNLKKPLAEAKEKASEVKSGRTGKRGSKETGSSDSLQRELKQKLEKEKKLYKPLNNPQKLPEDGPYVDPVGVDPTHGIVEGIIATQVRKVGGLMQLVAQEDPANRGKGELQYPIRLSTACSGTDAPSIALGLIKESLDKAIGSKDHGFNYTHDMSCEIEPFKQAYISRNFPGVLLFPDITKLTAAPEVLDVYGRPQQLPDADLFVAGTSCKDFSMLKTRDRQDIEDKGTSGETFLAAVEYLDIQQPPTAIFGKNMQHYHQMCFVDHQLTGYLSMYSENVDGAPWAKMQEYIRGRIDLAERNNTKAIKDANKKAGRFSWGSPFTFEEPNTHIVFFQMPTINSLSPSTGTDVMSRNPFHDKWELEPDLLWRVSLDPVTIPAMWNPLRPRRARKIRKLH